MNKKEEYSGSGACAWILIAILIFGFVFTVGMLLN